MTSDPSANGHTPSRDLPPVAKRVLSVGELEKSLPGPEQVATQAAQLLAASVGAISLDDVTEMMGAVVAQAKKGDAKSVRLVLDHLSAHKPRSERRSPPVSPPPIQLQPVEPELPKPVVIEGPGTEQHRRLLAFVLLAHQPMSVIGLGAQCGLSGDVLAAVLDHEWFQRRGSEVRLTPAGRRAVG